MGGSHQQQGERSPWYHQKEWTSGNNIAVVTREGTGTHVSHRCSANDEEPVLSYAHCGYNHTQRPSSTFEKLLGNQHPHPHAQYGEKWIPEQTQKNNGNSVALPSPIFHPSSGSKEGGGWTTPSGHHAQRPRMCEKKQYGGEKCIHDTQNPPRMLGRRSAFNQSKVDDFGEERLSFGERFDWVADAIETLQAACSRIDINAEIHIVGSVGYDLGDAFSDLDVVILSTTKDAKSFLLELQEHASQLVGKKMNPRGIIPGKIPVLVLEVPRGRIDVCLNQTHPIGHKKFMRRVLETLPWMRPILLFVKRWLRVRKIPLTKQGGIPQIAFLLIAIQACYESGDVYSFFELLAEGSNWHIEFQEPFTDFLDGKAGAPQELCRRRTKNGSLIVLDPCSHYGSEEESTSMSDLGADVPPATLLLYQTECKRVLAQFTADSSRVDDAPAPPQEYVHTQCGPPMVISTSPSFCVPVSGRAPSGIPTPTFLQRSSMELPAPGLGCAPHPHPPPHMRMLGSSSHFLGAEEIVSHCCVCYSRPQTDDEQELSKNKEGSKEAGDITRAGGVVKRAASSVNKDRNGMMNKEYARRSWRVTTRSKLCVRKMWLAGTLDEERNKKRCNDSENQWSLYLIEGRMWIGASIRTRHARKDNQTFCMVGLAVLIGNGIIFPLPKVETMINPSFLVQELDCKGLRVLPDCMETLKGMGYMKENARNVLEHEQKCMLDDKPAPEIEEEKSREDSNKSTEENEEELSRENSKDTGATEDTT